MYCFQFKQRCALSENEKAATTKRSSREDLISQFSKSEMIFIENEKSWDKIKTLLESSKKLNQPPAPINYSPSKRLMDYLIENKM